MMNKKIFSLLALALPACTAIVESNPDSRNEGLEAITELVANVPPIVFDDDTKSAVSTDGAFTWIANDRLGFWPSTSDVTFGAPTQCVFHVQASPGSNVCDRFCSNGWGLIAGNTYYTYSPYDENATASAVSISYRDQNQTSNNNANHVGAYEYLHACCVATSNTMVDYNHIGSFLKCVLTINSEYASSTFTEVTLSSTSAVFTESAKYNPCQQQVSLTDKVMKTSMSISLNSGNGFKSTNNQLIVYAMMCPAQWQGKTITVTAHDTDNHEFTGSFTPSKNQTAGKGTVVNLTLTATGGYYDLSRSESANCYIVSAAGDYKFKAVKGNTNTAVNASTVSVLWESVGTTSAPAVGSIVKNVSYDNGYVRFSTPGTFKKGNALIAARDAQKNILWSWHIWCTDEPEDEEYKFDAGYLMDRNLGALATTGNLSAGLYYQWGRKDPFPGTASISSCVQSATTLGAFPTPVESDSNTGTIAYATSHPTTIIKGTNQLDWMRNFDTTERTWYKANGGKTAYDPCPPGYRVTQGSTTANTTAGRGFWGVAFGIDNVVHTVNYACTVPAGTISFSTSGKYLSVPLEGGKTAFYPAAGCVNDAAGTMEYVGDHAFFWTNYPAGTDHTYSNWNTQYTGVLDINMSNSNGAVTVNWNSGRASGKNIRCQLMRTDTASSASPNEVFSTVNTNW